jgi:hypothetical protein
MTLAIILTVVAMFGVAVWAIIRPARRNRPGPDNNWRNEDYMAREADGTWAEGSAHPKSEPNNSLGWPLGKTK